MEISTRQFQNQCLQFLEIVKKNNTEILITHDGKAMDRLIHAEKESKPSFLGSLVGAGKTVGDITKPLEDEWDLD